MASARAAVQISLIESFWRAIGVEIHHLCMISLISGPRMPKELIEVALAPLGFVPQDCSKQLDDSQLCWVYKLGASGMQCVWQNKTHFQHHPYMWGRNELDERISCKNGSFSGRDQNELIN